MDTNASLQDDNGSPVSFEIGNPLVERPKDYADLLSEIKARVQHTRLRTVLSANAAVISLYWDIGHLILVRQEERGWGAKVISRLARDLRIAFPEMKGFSATNLKYMRRFAEELPDKSIGQLPADQLPWFHIVSLLTRLSDIQQREWYATNSLHLGWSRSMLVMQIQRNAYERSGKAINNFSDTLPSLDSDLVDHIFKDPYLFDFLGTADLRREREVEQALIDHIQKFLIELGSGFAFVGRQVRLQIGDSEFYVDLLFYHLHLRCYVIVELKAVPFDPAFVGTMNVYLSAADDVLRHPDDRPTIGLLLCRSKERLVVEYALRDLNKPLGVADWETQLTRQLPDDLASSLPSIEQLELELQDDAE